MHMDRDIYCARLKLNGKENEATLIAAVNLATTLNVLRRFEETKSLLRESMPVARRILGVGHDHTLRMRTIYATALTMMGDPSAPLDDLREAVTTLEETKRTAQRLLGGAHPVVVAIEQTLGGAREVLRARETPSSSPPSESV